MERSWDDGSMKVDEKGEQEKDSPYFRNEHNVDVKSLPQKKGLVIKHVEYLVTSEKHQSQV